jgi:hypothetical protein
MWLRTKCSQPIQMKEGLEKKKKKIKYPSENLHEAPGIDLWLKTSMEETLGLNKKYLIMKTLTCLMRQYNGEN